MNAAIDLGNTSAKIGIFDAFSNELIASERGIPVEKIAAFLANYTIEHLIISSVTKSKGEIEALFSDFQKKIILDSQTSIPIRNDYATPETLGYDRLAAAVGANAIFPEQNCLIIDLGTAIKYDFISAEGAFKGGIISLGMNIRFKALHTFTQKLPLLEAEGIPPLIGNSTKSCIQSGVINGIVAELNGIIEEYNQFTDLKVIICGGDAPFFESQIKYTKFALPNLVLIGLNRIVQYNVEKNYWANEPAS